jgi:HEAT repeat protein
MQEVGLSLLARFGKPDDANLAVSFVAAEQFQVVKAAMDVLHNQKLSSFPDYAAQFLGSENLDVRLHAVHLLRSLDPAEAFIYLKALLRNKSPMIRQKAIRELVLLPFGQAETLFLNYIGVESYPLLLVSAGLGLAFNPKTDLPLKVFDILATSRGLKRHIVQIILYQIVEAIKQSGILQQPVEQYMAELKGSLDARKEQMQIAWALQDIARDDREVRFRAVQILVRFAARPEIAKVLQERQSQESDEEIKALLTGSAESAKSDAAPTEPVGPEKSLEEELSAGTFAALPPRRQRQLFGTVVDQSAFRKVKDVLRPFLLNPPTRSLQLDLIALFGKWGDRFDVGELMQLLRQADPGVLAACIKSICNLDIDAILPHLNRLLTHEDPRVKSATLEAYVASDKEGAIHYLQAMLRSVNPNTRRLALTYMPLLDYPSVEPMLMTLLEREPTEDIRLQGALMVAMNPTADGMWMLYRIAHNDFGSPRTEFKETWNSALLAAQPVLGKNDSELTAEFLQRLTAEKETKQKAAPVYSYQKVLGKKEEEPPVREFIPAGADEASWRLKVAAAVVFGVPLLWYLAFGEGGPGKPPTPGTGTSTRYESASHRVEHAASAKNSGYIKTPELDAVFVSPAYGAMLERASREQEESAKEIENKHQEYYKQLAKNENEDKIIREMALAQLNTNLLKGQQLLRDNMMTDAEEYLLRVLQDPDSNPVAKVLACQALADIARQNKNKDGFLKYTELLFKEIPNLPDFGKVPGLENFRGNFEKLIQVSDLAKNPDKATHFMNAFQKDGSTYDGAQERLETLRDVTSQWDSEFK